MVPNGFKLSLKPLCSVTVLLHINCFKPSSELKTSVKLKFK